jgi:hypothetical protein
MVLGGGGIGQTIANSSSAPTAIANRDGMCVAMVLPPWRHKGIIARRVRNRTVEAVKQAWTNIGQSLQRSEP